MSQPTVTSTIDVKKTTAWGESGFPATFLDALFADAELPFGHPGRNYDNAPAHFDAFDDHYGPRPVDPPEEDIVHYGPGDRPLCGEGSDLAVHTDGPHQVAGCGDCLELVTEDLSDNNHYAVRWSTLMRPAGGRTESTATFGPSARPRSGTSCTCAGAGAVVDEALGEEFGGILVSDFYVAYHHYPAKTAKGYRLSIAGLKCEIGNRLPDVSFHHCRPFR